MKASVFWLEQPLYVVVHGHRNTMGCVLLEKYAHFYSLEVEKAKLSDETMLTRGVFWTNMLFSLQIMFDYWSNLASVLGRNGFFALGIILESNQVSFQGLEST